MHFSISPLASTPTRTNSAHPARPSARARLLGIAHEELREQTQHTARTHQHIVRIKGRTRDRHGPLTGSVEREAHYSHNSCAVLTDVVLRNGSEDQARGGELRSTLELHTLLAHDASCIIEIAITSSPPRSSNTMCTP